jgi:hypothetical protein
MNQTERELYILAGVIRLTSEYGDSFKVIKNPTRKQFFAISHSLVNYKSILTDKDFYIWPSYNAHHSEVAEDLGVDDEANPIIFGRINSINKPFGIEIYDTTEIKKVKSHPYIKYLFDKEKPVFFYDYKAH